MVFSLQGRPHSPAHIRSVRRTIRVVVPPVKIRAGRPVDRLTYRIPGTALVFQVQLTSQCTWIESESSSTKLHFILHPLSFILPPSVCQSPNGVQTDPQPARFASHADCLRSKRLSLRQTLLARTWRQGHPRPAPSARCRHRVTQG